jgi:hypothetical protein
MAHPLRYSEDDPFLARVREIALALPEAAEKISHGHPNFFTQKVFAVYGGMVKGNHSSGAYAQALLIKPDADERMALLEEERGFVPAYYGPSGWVGVNFRIEEPDWSEIADLLDMSYRNTASKRLVRLLDDLV